MRGWRMMHWWRATSFGAPIGPWRDQLDDVFEDLAAQGLGCADEAGTFFVTVPGGYERRSEWEETEESDYRPRPTLPMRAISHGRRR